MTNDQILERSKIAGVVPVLTIHDASKAVDLAKSLIAGGLDVLEVTLRTPQAMDAIKAITAAGLDCVVGVGTVTTQDHVIQCKAAGADFLVTPATPTDLIPALIAFGGPVFTGVATASEAMNMVAYGFSNLKFFPAEQAGGASYLKALSAPLPHLKFMPTGGVKPSNMADYLCLPNVIAVGGSWIAPPVDINAGNWADITARAAEAKTLAQAARPA